MQVPDEAVWGSIPVVGGIIVWFMTLERRLNARLTRQEHADICETHNQLLEKKMDEIVSELRRQNEATLKHREWMGENLGTIRTQVAVMQDRMGGDPFEDETRFQRGRR